MKNWMFSVALTRLRLGEKKRKEFRRFMKKRKLKNFGVINPKEKR
jgi:hypothetical protein